MAKFKPDCPFANPSMSAMAVHIPLDFVSNTSIGVLVNGGLHDRLPAPPPMIGGALGCGSGMVPLLPETQQVNAPKEPRGMARPLQIGDVDGPQFDVTGAIGPVLGAPVAKPASKLSLVLELLHKDGGTSLTAIVDATGWLPHTARSALTGLRKKGHAIVRDKIDGATCYSIAPVAPE